MQAAAEAMGGGKPGEKTDSVAHSNAGRSFMCALLRAYRATRAMNSGSTSGWEQRLRTVCSWLSADA